MTTDDCCSGAYSRFTNIANRAPIAATDVFLWELVEEKKKIKLRISCESEKKYLLTLLLFTHLRWEQQMTVFFSALTANDFRLFSSVTTDFRTFELGP